MNQLLWFIDNSRRLNPKKHFHNWFNFLLFLKYFMFTLFLFSFLYYFSCFVPQLYAFLLIELVLSGLLLKFPAFSLPYICGKLFFCCFLSFDKNFSILQEKVIYIHAISGVHFQLLLAHQSYRLEHMHSDTSKWKRNKKRIYDALSVLYIFCVRKIAPT